jgi:hypothetical protein
LLSEALGALAGFEPDSSPRTRSVIAASKPSSAVGFSNLRFVMFVCAFMTFKLAMPLDGSNDNYHHISANDSKMSLGIDRPVES